MNENENSLNQKLGVNIGIEGINKFSDSLKNGYSSAKDSFKDITQSLNDEMSGAFDKVKGASSSLFDSINDASGQTDSVLQQTRDAVTNHVNEIGDSMKSVWNTTDLKLIDKYDKQLRKKVGQITSSYALMEDATGISADDATGYYKELTKISKTVDGEFNLYKSFLGIKNKKEVAGARLEMLKFLGEDKDAFLETYKLLMEQEGMTADKAGAVLRDSFRNGGNQMSMDLKKKIIPSIISSYKELTDNLNMKFDIKGQKAYTAEMMRSSHILSKSGIMDQDKAMEVAESFAKINALMADDKMRAGMFNSEETADLIKNDAGIRMLMGEMGGKDSFANLIQEKGMLGALLEAKSKMKDKKQMDQFLDSLPKLNAMLGDTMSGEVLDSFKLVLTQNFKNTKKIADDYDKAQAKAIKENKGTLEDIRARNKKYWKSQINSAEKYADYLEKQTDYKLGMLTQAPADKFIKRRAEILKDFTVEAIDLAKDGDTYFTGSMIKRFSMLKRMGIMGLFADLEGKGKISGANAQISEIAESLGSVALNAAPAITAMNTMGIKFGGLGVIAKPFTSSLGLMNKASLGMFGSLTKLSGVLGASAFGMSKLRKSIGDDKIMGFLKGDLRETGNYLQKIKEGLSYDFTRVFLKKQMVFQKEFNKMTKGSELYNQIAMGNKVISNETINSAFKGTGNKSKKAREMIFAAYGINAPNLKNAADIENARKQVIEINRKRSFSIAEKEIKERANKFIEILDSNLSFMGKAMGIIWDRIKINIFGGIDTNGDIVDPLYIKIVKGLNDLMGKLKSGSLFNKNSENVMSDKMKAVLGFGIAGAFMSPTIRGGFSKGIVGLISGSTGMATKAAGLLFKTAFSNRGKLGKLAFTFTAIGAGVKLYEMLSNPGKRTEILGSIESNLGLKPETLSVFSNFKTFFSDTLIPKMGNFISDAGSLLYKIGKDSLNFLLSKDTLMTIGSAFVTGVGTVLSKLWDNKALMGKIALAVGAFMLMKKAWFGTTNYMKMKMNELVMSAKQGFRGMASTAWSGKSVNFGANSFKTSNGIKGRVANSWIGKKVGGLKNSVMSQRGSASLGMSGKLAVGAMLAPMIINGVQNGISGIMSTDSIASTVGSSLTSLGGLAMMVNPLVGGTLLVIGSIISHSANVFKRLKQVGADEFEKMYLKDKKLQSKIYDFNTSMLIMSTADEELKRALYKSLKDDLLKIAISKNLSGDATKKLIQKATLGKELIEGSTSSEISAHFDTFMKTQNEVIQKKVAARLKKESNRNILSIGWDELTTLGGYSNTVMKNAQKDIDTIGTISTNFEKQFGNMLKGTNDKDTIAKILMSGKEVANKYGLSIGQVLNKTNLNFTRLDEMGDVFKKVSEMTDFSTNSFLSDKMKTASEELTLLSDPMKSGGAVINNLLGANRSFNAFAINMKNIDSIVEKISSDTVLDSKQTQKMYMNSFGSALGKQFDSWKQLKDFMGSLDSKQLAEVQAKIRKESEKLKLGQIKTDLEYIRRNNKIMNIDKGVDTRIEQRKKDKYFDYNDYYGNKTLMRTSQGNRIAKSAMFGDMKQSDIDRFLKIGFRDSKGDIGEFKKFLMDNAKDSKILNKNSYLTNSLVDKLYSTVSKGSTGVNEGWDKKYQSLRQMGALSADDIYKNEQSKFAFASENTMATASLNQGLGNIKFGSKEDVLNMKSNQALNYMSTVSTGMNDIYNKLYHSFSVTDNLMADSMANANKKMLIDAIGGTDKIAEHLKKTGVDFSTFSMDKLHEFTLSMDDQQRKAFLESLRRYKEQSGKLGAMLDNDVSSFTSNIKSGLSRAFENLAKEYTFLNKFKGLLSSGNKDDAKKAEALRKNKIATDKLDRTRAVVRAMKKVYERETGSKFTKEAEARFKGFLAKKYKAGLSVDDVQSIIRRDSLTKIRKKMFATRGEKQEKANKYKARKELSRKEGFQLYKKSKGANGIIIDDIKYQLMSALGVKNSASKKYKNAFNVIQSMNYNDDNKISQAEYDYFKLNKKAGGKNRKNILDVFNKLQAEQAKKVGAVSNMKNENIDKKVDERMSRITKNQAVQSDVYTQQEIKNLVSNEEGVKLVSSRFTRLSNGIEALIDTLNGSGINVRVVAGTSVPNARKGKIRNAGGA